MQSAAQPGRSAMVTLGRLTSSVLSVGPWPSSTRIAMRNALFAVGTGSTALPVNRYLSGLAFQ